MKSFFLLKACSLLKILYCITWKNMFVTVDSIQNNWQHFNNLAILDFTRQWNDPTCRWSIICTHLLIVICSFWRSYRIADTERLFPVKTPTVSFFFLAFHSPYWWRGMKWRDPHRQHLREWYDSKPLWYTREQIIHQQVQPITMKRTLAVSIALWDQINDNTVLILM